jgi:hypothetical protein
LRAAWSGFYRPGRQGRDAVGLTQGLAPEGGPHKGAAIAAMGQVAGVGTRC